MKPKEKAKELYQRADFIVSNMLSVGSNKLFIKHLTKECASEVIKEVRLTSDYERIGYWEEVLNETKKL